MNAKKRIQVPNDPAAVGQARMHAMRLAAEHGMEYPAFVEVAKRIDEHLDRLLDLEMHQNKSNRKHGKPWKPKQK